MDIQRFSEIIMAYGGNPQHWAAHEREAALQMLQQSSEAKRLQKEALALDVLLDVAPMPHLSNALRKRIFKATRPPLSQQLLQWLFNPSTLRLATAFAFPFLIVGITWIAMPSSQLTNETRNAFAQDVSFVALLEEELTLAEFLL